MNRKQIEIEKIKAELCFAVVTSKGPFYQMEDEYLDSMAGQLYWIRQQMEEEKLKQGYV